MFQWKASKICQTFGIWKPSFPPFLFVLFPKWMPWSFLTSSSTFIKEKNLSNFHQRSISNFWWVIHHYFYSFQGTIVDRIDYNIENTSIQVEEGVEQLKKAARYQKKDRKMYCIVILAVIDVILFCIWYNN